MRIPRILHQIWIQGEAAIPKRHRNKREMWARTHPEWQYVLWDDSKIRALIRAYMPELEKWYDDDDLEAYAAKADLARCLILFVHGGMYIDIDVSVGCSLRAAIAYAEAHTGRDGHVLALSQNPEPTPRFAYMGIYNAWIASTPKNFRWIHVVLPTFLEKMNLLETSTSLAFPSLKISSSHGPVAWYRVFDTAWSNDDDGFVLVPREFVWGDGGCLTHLGDDSWGNHEDQHRAILLGVGLLGLIVMYWLLQTVVTKE